MSSVGGVLDNIDFNGLYAGCMSINKFNEDTNRCLLMNPLFHGIIAS